MKTHSRFFLLLSASALAACSSVTVTTDYDHSASFAKYKTYSLAPATHDQTLAPSGEAALRDALKTHLSARGMSETDQAKADLDVVRHVFLEEKTSTHQYTNWGYGYQSGWPYRYGTYGMWSGAPQTYVDVTNYTEGTLVLDFVDTHTKKLVFRGTGVAVVGKSGTNADKIREAVAKIVADLPAGTTH